MIRKNSEKWTKFLSLALCFIMLISIAIVPNTAVAATPASGTYGTCDWEITADGVLTIEAGQLPDTNKVKIPWASQATEITKVVVKEGVKTSEIAANLFSGLTNATEIDVSGLDTSQAKNIERMFNVCSKLKSVDVSGFNTKNVVNMIAIFEYCGNLIEVIGLENWDTSKVTNMSNLFRESGIQNLASIEGWNVSNVKILNSTFYRTPVKSLDLSSWKVSELQDLHYTFAESGLTDLNISGWDINDMTFQSHSFAGTRIEKLDLSGWKNKNLPVGYSRELAFSGMRNLKEITLGSDFVFHSNDGFNTWPPNNDEYTGKWIAVGDGTVDNPKGDTYTVSELRALYTVDNPGPLETYVWERKIVKHNVLLSVHTLIDGVTGEATSDLLEKMKPVLVAEDGTEIQGVIQDNGHTFEFKDVPAGTYKLAFTYPEGYKFAEGKTEDGIDYIDTGYSAEVNDETQLFTRLEKIKVVPDPDPDPDPDPQPPKPPKPNPGTPSKPKPTPEKPKKATAILANGSKYTDVLTATVLANERSCPILLTEKDSLTEETLNELHRRGIGDVIISGGVNSVSEKVVEQLKEFNVVRISGANRYETAREIGKAVRELTGKHDGAVLVDGTNFPDVITISALASQRRVPILITEPAALNPVTEATIKEWKLSQVTIGGQTNSVSEAVENTVDALVANVDRIGGVDRYETASLIGAEVRKNSTNKTDMILVDGTNFPDGITVNSLAAKHGCPIHLTNPNILTSITKEDIEKWEIKNILVVGGLNSVSEDIYNSLNVNKERLAGENRYSTAVKISQRLDNAGLLSR